MRKIKITLIIQEENDIEKFLDIVKNIISNFVHMSQIRGSFHFQNGNIIEIEKES